MNRHYKITFTLQCWATKLLNYCIYLNKYFNRFSAESVHAYNNLCGWKMPVNWHKNVHLFEKCIYLEITTNSDGVVKDESSLSTSLFNWQLLSSNVYCFVHWTIILTWVNSQMLGYNANRHVLPHKLAGKLQHVVRFHQEGNAWAARNSLSCRSHTCRITYTKISMRLPCGAMSCAFLVEPYLEYIFWTWSIYLDITVKKNDIINLWNIWWSKVNSNDCLRSTLFWTKR